MTWEILLAVSLCSYSIAVLLQRLILKENKSHPIAYSIITPMVAGLILSTAFLFKGIPVELLLTFWPNLLLMVLLYGASNIFTYKALKYTEASTFTILNASRALWSVSAAIIVLNEAFGLKQIFGTILVVLSVILASWKGQKIRFSKGEVFTLVAAFAFGVEFINDAYLLRYFDAFVYLPIAFVVPTIGVWAIYPKATQPILAVLKSRTIWKVILLGSLYAISAGTIFLAYQVGRNAAQIAPINETSTILIVFLAAIFLKERKRLFAKVLAAGISFLGVYLIK